MSTSNQTYKELAVPYFKEVFDSIDEVMLNLKIPYYLIGASAIALESLKKGIKPSRATKDIDFAIMISSIRDFKTIVEELGKYGFNKAEAPWTLYHPGYNAAIDLLPFGEIEEDFTVSFNERQTDLHLLGFREVLKDVNTVKIEDKAVRVPSLPGILVLKLIAWSDRPEERGNDLYDILWIIEHYFELEYDEIIEKHNDIFPERDFDQLKIAARVLGRKASKFFKMSEALKTRIQSTIDKNTLGPETSEIAKKWVQNKAWDLEYAHTLLEELKLGFFEKQ
jgi:predicted nucleotidyltransferase